ncbi:hypothetical protein AZE42_08527 [Rhizopogon vesiculosus]|uniref:Uncharacterized protein n=1 Tax=Rhizopogon vesiculosus TaxID=180088 RepID=A0A1J8PM78_9AGAM|nr:hypothetical protein AZE42_08527 [Rhizopogon vesiculosus]
MVASGNAALSLISIIMLGIAYSFQALIFIIKRETIQHTILAYLLVLVHGRFLGEIIGNKVVVNEDEWFHESLVPLNKFSEYEAGAWEHGSHQSDETGLSKPRSNRPPLSRQGFLIASTHRTLATSNLTKSSNPNHRTDCPPYDVLPQMSFMPFSGGPCSAHGSHYGGQMPIIPPLGYQHSGSVYDGMMPQDSRSTMMMNMPMMTGDSQAGGFGMLPAMGGDTRPLSMFSMTTSVNAFAGPSFDLNTTLMTSSMRYNEYLTGNSPKFSAEPAMPYDGKLFKVLAPGSQDYH